MQHAIPGLRRYFLSCGLLLLPIFAWNAALTPFLPGAWSASEFWRDIPPALALAENASRIMVATLPFLMPLERGSAFQRQGLAVWAIGVALYLLSWLAILAAPNSRWATSALGFMAPAYTPLVWLAGLAILGQRLFWGRWYRWWIYLIPALVFIAAHVGHAAIVFVR